MQAITGQVTGFDAKDGKLTEIKVTGLDGVTRRVPLDCLLVFYGLSPKLGPIADWGLEIDRRQIVVDTEKFMTNIPGIFAVGDINIYPGKKKLILSGFLCRCAIRIPAKENPLAIYDDVPETAQGTRRRDTGFRLNETSPFMPLTGWLTAFFPPLSHHFERTEIPP